MRTTTTRRPPQDRYFELIRAFPLRPIHSESELAQATSVLVKLVKSKPEEKMDAGERDYMEALAMFVQRFEQSRNHSLLPKRTPLERLKFLMQEQGLSVNDLGRIIGSQPNASLLLRGKRSMSKTQILRLAEHFAVSPALFLE